MEITITGRHLEITDPIRQYAEDKVSKLPRYFDRVLSIEVIADKRDNHSYELELIVHVEHHDPFVVSQASEDLYACIDQTNDRMERLLRDHKERLRNHKHKASR